MTDLARGSPSDQSVDWAPRCHGVATYQNNSFTAITLENHHRSVALWLEGGLVIERRCVRILRTSLLFYRKEIRAIELIAGCMNS